MTIYTSRHRAWQITNTQEKIDAIFKPEVKERFWAKVRIGRETDCWPWLASKTRYGYGSFGFNSLGGFRSNRVAYMITKGPIPSDLHILHLCDNRACCNPAHLIAGTVQMNNAQRDAQLKCTKGEKHHSAKLTDAEVIEIYKSDEKISVLAKRYGVTDCPIRRIKGGITWKHITRKIAK